MTVSIETLKALLPDYAKDLKLNLSSLLREETLTEQQLWGTILASAIASRNQETTVAIENEASQHLSNAAMTAAKAAVAIMSMSNVYYRFVHLASQDSYQTMPAKLRMNIIANPGVEKADFELWSLAISAINGCGLCVDSHENELRKAGMSKDAIQLAVRIASVLHAVAVVIESEGGAAGVERSAA